MANHEFYAYFVEGKEYFVYQNLTAVTENRLSPCRKTA